MKTRRFVTITFLVLLVSFASAQTSDPHSAEGSHITGMPSEKIWMVLEMTVQDSFQYQEYQKKMEPLIEKFGGKYKVRSGGMGYDLGRNGKVTPVEGNWNPDRFFIVEWDNMEQLQKFSTSKEYGMVAKLRGISASTKSFIVREYSKE